MPATHHMQVEMGHGLAAVVAGIDDDAVAFREAVLACNLRRNPHQVTEESSVFGDGVGKGSDVLARNDENMYGRFGADVGKGVNEVILIDGR